MGVRAAEAMTMRSDIAAISWNCAWDMFCTFGAGVVCLLLVGWALLVHLRFVPCRGRLTFFVLPKKVSKERRARDGDTLLEFV
ncbi:hypothetical protein VZ52_10160 [Ralstonia mannitolilytica]|nr:hypothetical protein VZ52_10160 [Ralstonia mannitolilytica]